MAGTGPRDAKERGVKRLAYEFLCGMAMAAGVVIAGTVIVTALAWLV